MKPRLHRGNALGQRPKLIATNWRLCRCEAFGCKDNVALHPETQRPIPGNFLGSKEFATHQQAEHAREECLQTERSLPPVRFYLSIDHPVRNIYMVARTACIRIIKVKLAHLESLAIVTDHPLLRHRQSVQGRPGRNRFIVLLHSNQSSASWTIRWTL